LIGQMFYPGSVIKYIKNPNLLELFSYAAFKQSNCCKNGSICLWWHNSLINVNLQAILPVINFDVLTCCFTPAS